MIKTLARSIREYKKASILAPFFVAIEVVLEILIPYLMGYVIDYGVNAVKGYTWCNNLGELIPLILKGYKGIVPDGALATGNFTIVWQLSLVLLACALLSLSCGVLAGRYAAIAGSGYAGNLRHDLYYKIQEFSFANLDKFSTPSLITRLTSDVTNVQMAYQMIVRIAVRAPIMLVLAFVMSVRIKWQLSLIFLGVIPIIAVGAYLLLSRTHPIYERVFKKYDDLNAVVEENLRGIRVVKSYVRSDYEKQKFGKTSTEIFTDFVHAEKISAIINPLMMMIVYVCMLILAWLSAKYIWIGELQSGDFVSMLTYTIQILSSFIMVAMVFMMIVISHASMKRVCEVLNEESTIQNPKEPIFNVENGDITLKNVSFAYGTEDADNLSLSNINLNIKSGETVGIIGSTGSGKTTMTQLIPRLYDATQGIVEVGGVDVRKYDLQALRNSVSMVLQKNTLFEGSVKENLLWGNENADDEEIKKACILAQADGFVSAMEKGYDSHVEQGGANFSGGQKQRLCIARALLKKPKVLILDDSTSAVDTKTDAEIRKAFKEVIPGTTKIIIAQRIGSVMDADKIIVMDGGKINAVGTHEELLATNAIYQDVYTSQQEAGGDFDEDGGEE